MYQPYFEYTVNLKISSVFGFQETPSFIGLHETPSLDPFSCITDSAIQAYQGTDSSEVCSFKFSLNSHGSFVSFKIHLTKNQHIY